MKQLSKIIFFFILVLAIGIIVTVKTIKTSSKKDIKKENTTKKETVYLLKAEQLKKIV